ncbi:hypothetical protein KFZ56_13225 [Virgibacillus sp. NKC19-3]|uniref:hypothetical protein n=1 Tax=Virgibacillus saliphilus TaxID=2831674 RepID=UPI001C9AAA94|nr:hypothetical protein [Virgibacillus sp. NKC19-3]MBY7143988.1 hypothetical protein [Virgibacillus sp. NKC19-3]
MKKKPKKDYSDFSNVDSMRNVLIPEEYPEGAFGSAVNKDEQVESKSTPWKEGQKRDSAFVFPDKKLHNDLPRQTPGAHPIHDEPGNPKESE